MKKGIYLLLILLTGIVLSCKKVGTTPSAPLIPKLNEILPISTEVGGLLTIKGENLSTIESVVFDDNVHVAPDIKTETELKVKTPNLAEGIHTILVESSAGKSNKLNLTVVVPKPPVITGSDYKVLNEQEFSISGTNMQGVTGVNFEGSVLTPKTVTETSVIVQLPKFNIFDRKVYKVHLLSSLGVSNEVSVEVIPRPKIVKRIPQEPYSGLPFIIKGESLSWILSISFGDAHQVGHSRFRKRNDDEIILDIPREAGTGKKVLIITTEAGQIREEITLGNLSDKGGVNPGNIAVNPGNIGTVGSFSAVCTGYMHFVYINGFLHEMLYGNCNGPYVREVFDKSYHTLSPYGNLDSEIELGYEHASGSFTGNIYLANVNREGLFQITHYGKMLEKEAFDTNKFVTTALMISLEDGEISRICTPRIHSSWGLSSIGMMNENGSFYFWGSTSGNNTTIDSKCIQCSECK